MEGVIYSLSEYMSHQASIDHQISPQYLLLGLLEIEPNYGYKLHRLIKSDLRHVWRLSQSQIYNTLRRMEGRRWIWGVTETQDKRPDRRRFTLTDEGRGQLSSWLATPIGPSLRDFRVAFLSKVYLGRRLSRVQLVSILDQQQGALQKGLLELEKLQERMGDKETISALSLRLRVRHLKALLSWINDYRMDLLG